MENKKYEIIVNQDKPGSWVAKAINELTGKIVYGYGNSPLEALKGAIFHERIYG